MKNNPQIEKLFTQLYTNYHKELYRMYMKTHRSNAEADDAVNGFLLKFAEKMTDGRDITGKITDAFVKGSFKNHICDLFRKKKLSYFSELEQNDHEESDLLSSKRFDIAGTNSSDERIISQNNRSLVQLCFAQMKPQDAAYLTLRYIDDLGNQEIAKQLNQNSKYVALRINRAKAAFISVFKKLGFKKGDY